MQRGVFAKEPDQLPLFERIEANLLAMIRDIQVSGAWSADLSADDMFHRRFLLGRKTQMYRQRFTGLAPVRQSSTGSDTAGSTDHAAAST
jgi:hypothetical protein